MKRSVGLLFLIPALLISAPVVAQERAAKVGSHTKASIRYVTLDRMIRGFAAEAQQRREHASRNAPRNTVLAQR